MSEYFNSQLAWATRPKDPSVKWMFVGPMRLAFGDEHQSAENVHEAFDRLPAAAVHDDNRVYLHAFAVHLYTSTDEYARIIQEAEANPAESGLVVEDEDGTRSPERVFLSLSHCVDNSSEESSSRLIQAAHWFRGVARQLAATGDREELEKRAF